MIDTEANLFHEPVKLRGANRTRTLVTGAVCFALLIVVAVAGALLASQATATDLAAKNQVPSPAHLFGTDRLGRDMLVRTISGLSTSIGIGLLAAFVSSVIALVLGTAAALGGKKADAVVTWLVDLMMSIPHIVLLILIS